MRTLLLAAGLALAAPAALLATAPAAHAASVDLAQLAGQWRDPEGVVYTIARAPSGDLVLTQALHDSGLQLSIRTYSFTPADARFTVYVDSTDTEVNYELLSVSGDTLQARWWGSAGSGTETLTRVGQAPTAEAPPPAPVSGSGPVGVWRDAETGSRFFVEEVRGQLAMIGGINPDGSPVYVTTQGFDGRTLTWTYQVPASGYEVSYACTVPAEPTQWSCTWSGTAGRGTETLQRTQ